ncbi:hypothetical protein AM592_14075 [Bacillus gobiensis]|uniref:Uncharacterized protein n=1 Tax=Bacillus gobiensis TaxID=1441095 RepID=A0A0M4GAK7_9BACI|nr:hypothetical protein AM592_14075 [Bacillus gobiensis]
MRVESRINSENRAKRVQITHKPRKSRITSSRSFINPENHVYSRTDFFYIRNKSNIPGILINFLADHATNSLIPRNTRNKARKKRSLAIEDKLFQSGSSINRDL